MLLGVNIFLPLLGTHFNPRCTRSAQNESESGKNIFMPAMLTLYILLAIYCLHYDISYIRYYTR